MIDLPDTFHLDNLREAKVRTEDLDSLSLNLCDEGPIPSQDHSRAELEISQNKISYLPVFITGHGEDHVTFTDNKVRIMVRALAGLVQNPENILPIAYLNHYKKLNYN